MKKYLAIDIGASSGRGIVGSFDGEKLYLKENHRFSNDPVNILGRLHWDILRLYHEVKKALHQTVIDGDGITSIGIDAWGVDYGLLSKNGTLLSNPIHYRDGRTHNIEKWVWNKVPFRDMYRITGIQSLSFNTIYQLCAELHASPFVFDNVDKLLFVPDLLNYFLTGKLAIEQTIASTGAVIDIKNNKISNELLSMLNIPSDIFPQLVSPGTHLGKMLPLVQEEAGVSDISVINVASHDTASAVIAVPSETYENIYISSGTWSLMGTELEKPLISESARLNNFTNEKGYENRTRFLKNIMGLWILQESRRWWAVQGKNYSFNELEQMASNAPPLVSFIDPDDPIFSPPGDMPARIVQYCVDTNQYVPQNEGEIIRCIYESLALKYRYVAERITEMTGIKYTTINIVGGGSKDKLLNQMTADSCNITVVAGPVEATAIGNIVVQAIVDRELQDLNDGRELVRNSFSLTTFYSNHNERWENAYERFIHIIKR